MKRLERCGRLAALWWLLVMLACRAHAAQLSCEYRTQLDQLYAYGQMEQGVQMPLRLDAYLPTTCSNAPGVMHPPVMLLPGGGFGDTVVGKRQPPIVQMAVELARAGFAVFVAEYRPRLWHDVAPVSETMTPDELEAYKALAAQGPYPVSTAVEALMAVEDAFKLQAWIRSRGADDQLDLAAFGMMGPSSGATTSLSMAYMGDNLGVGDAGLHAVVDLWGDFFPHETMMPGEAPLLVVAGTADALIDYPLTTDTMHRAFLTGVDASRITMPGVGHGLVDADIFNRMVDGTGMTVFEVIVQFLEARLRPLGGQVWPPAGQGNEMTTAPSAAASR
ncbi:hypothetical protein [Ideonella sp.]|uniref:alpha/beta hydrolase n=1 Tax=Ideonella sp. TaxID=1929293 RepID=UPI002B488ACF|nr:hypothetical protein [Ideonella sp.]HJV69109.1 hypothetical protein [Ideonella sp.]